MISIQVTIYILSSFDHKLQNKVTPTHMCVHTNHNQFYKCAFEAYTQKFSSFLVTQWGKPQCITGWCWSTYSRIWLTKRHQTGCKPHYFTRLFQLYLYRPCSFLEWGDALTQAVSHAQVLVCHYYSIHHVETCIL